MDEFNQTFTKDEFTKHIDAKDLDFKFIFSNNEPHGLSRADTDIRQPLASWRQLKFELRIGHGIITAST